MIADALLSRLEKVRPTGHDRWVARCPAHKDGRPSLSIRVTPGDVILIHCFAECAVADIVAAVGLDASDLFPPRAPGVHSAKPRVSALSPLIATFEKDLIIVQIFVSDIGKGRSISDVDQATARASARRLHEAVREARCVY